MKEPGLSSRPPRSAYIHVPFCAHHCGYCNFTVIAGRNDLADHYLHAIEAEISWLSQTYELDTLYFGGGTPTQLTCEQLERLFSIIRERLPPAPDCETTVEANPADVSEAKAQALAALGANRVSLGAQSFHDAHLRALERDHRGDDIARSVQLLRKAGIGNIAIDLIFAAPGQSLSDWQRDLHTLSELQPEHISTYGLTFEKGTAFYNRLQRGEMRQAEEETELAMYLAAIETLTAAGYEHYEVSNFARPGYRSRHNEVYWTGRPYLAFGPGASRFADGRRETNHRSVTTYLKRVLAGDSPVAETETLAAEDAARERLIFGLRRMEGIRLDDFARDTGFSAEQLGGENLQRFLSEGLLEITGGSLRLTRRGLAISDSLWPELL